MMRRIGTSERRTSEFRARRSEPIGFGNLRWNALQYRAGHTSGTFASEGNLLSANSRKPGGQDGLNATPGFSVLETEREVCRNPYCESEVASVMWRWRAWNDRECAPDGHILGTLMPNRGMTWSPCRPKATVGS